LLYKFLYLLDYLSHPLLYNLLVQMKTPYQTIISIDKTNKLPQFLQIANGFIKNIQNGLLKTGEKLPGTRSLSIELNVNRGTIIAATDELYAQGWIEIIPQKGTFVSQNLPVIVPSTFGNLPNIKSKHILDETKIPINQDITLPFIHSLKYAFNDGLPDVRLAPREEMAKLYNHYLKFCEPSLLQYGPVYGQEKFRIAFSNMLNASRGMHTKTENILTTRGSQMSFSMIAMAFFQKNDEIIVGKYSYVSANMAFKTFGANINEINIDENGILVSEVEKLCKIKKVKALYITSHHYHPTTVTLKPDRRIELLTLAKKYGFFIIEDDYDYDFHYANAPILPLASSDTAGLVIYVGSFSKRIAPTFRVGYIAAAEHIIKELAKYRRILDRQGDAILENILADMIENGTLKRYANKSLKLYKERRDFTCQLLSEKLSDIIQFEKPNGGMAIWASFDKNYPLSEISKRCAKKNLYIPDGTLYPELNSCRLGFASMNLHEIEIAVGILEQVIREW
jgi:GntR family transcriptional regulator / MocR family aminotransferase